MILVEEAETRELLAWGPLIKALKAAFKSDIVSPAKHQHYIKIPDEPEAKIMMMPAWRSGQYVCVKLVNMFPGNAARKLPAVSGVVILFDGKTGKPLAQIDGGEVTARRTAGTSALAADYLARKDSKIHLVVGTGRVAWNLIFAHKTIRSLVKTIIWGRNAAKAREMALLARKLGVAAEASEDLDVVVQQSDIISCATFSPDPLVNGDWLSDGTHLDLVGGYRPDARETDDVSIERGSVFCDTLNGAPIAAGDLVQPLETGVLKLENLVDLYGLVNGCHPGRKSESEITVFKSVGASLEDFAAAVLIYESIK